MDGVLFAERAVFIKLDSVRIVFLILIVVVISLLTFRASQSDSGSTSFCHIFRLLKKLTPRMRSANSFYYTFKSLSTVFLCFFCFLIVFIVFCRFSAFSARYFVPIKNRCLAYLPASSVYSSRKTAYSSAPTVVTSSAEVSSAPSSPPP